MSYENIVIYTDGACAGNPGPGGWAAIIIHEDEHEEIISGGSRSTTNNIMEMTALLEALKRIKEPSNISIFSDSQYLVNGLKSWIYSWRRNNWVKSDGKPVLNKEIWQELYNLLKNHAYTLHWVKGHAHNEYNNKCDALAVKESLAYKRGEK